MGIDARLELSEQRRKKRPTTSQALLPHGVKPQRFAAGKSPILSASHPKGFPRLDSPTILAYTTINS